MVDFFQNWWKGGDLEANNFSPARAIFSASFRVLREQNKMSLFWAKTRLFDVKHPLCKMLERSFFGRVPTFYTEDA